MESVKTLQNFYWKGTQRISVGAEESPNLDPYFVNIFMTTTANVNVNQVKKYEGGSISSRRFQNFVVGIGYLDQK